MRDLLFRGWAPLALGAVAGAAPMAHYLDVQAARMAVEVRVNGFPVFESANHEGGAFSGFLGAALRNGNNVVQWSARTDPEVVPEEAYPWAQVEIAAAPPDARRTQDEPGEILFHGRIEPLGSVRALPLDNGSYTVLTGELVPDDGPASFREIAPRRWAFGVRIEDPALHIRGAPTALFHTGLSHTLVFGEIHFLRSGTDRHVVFRDLRLPAGGGRFALETGKIARGSRFLDEGGFDTIWIFGSAAEGVEAVRLPILEVSYSRRHYEEHARFSLEMPHAWTWERGEDVAEMAGDSPARAELMAFLRRLHRTVGTEPPEEWAPFFEAKTTDLAKAMNQAEAALREGQLAFFRNVAATPGWALEPFDEDRLLVTPVNPRVLHVRYVEDEGPLLSVPIMRPGAREPDRFKIPLFLSRVDGQWTIVR